MIAPVKLREILNYDPLTGAITNKKTKRLLQADHDGLVVVFCANTDGIKKKHKLKLDRIAYALAFGITPREDKRILHKNLDTSDNRLNNIDLVTRTVFLLVKEAHRNLTQCIKITNHPNDQFNYVVHWMEKNQEKQKVVHDITAARRIMLSLQLKYSKILTKYCVFD